MTSSHPHQHLLNALKKELLKPFEEKIDAWIEDFLNPAETIAELRDPQSQPCFECGAQTVIKHHVVPRLFGGTKTLPLCGKCHASAHSVKISGTQMIKAGLMRAKYAGVRLGRPEKHSQEAIDKILSLRSEDLSIRQIQVKMQSLGFKTPRSTIQRILYVHRERYDGDKKSFRQLE